MTNRATAEIPLEIDRVESSRTDAGTIHLRLAGRWLDPAGAEEDELLVVQIEGRRHRFPATRAPEPPGSQTWSASFELPIWAEPRQSGQAALWLGNAVIPVPASPGAGEPATSAALGRAVAPPSGASEAAAETPGCVPPRTASEPPGYPQPETPRSGPLADLLLKETVAALHEELERRTAELARIRGSLADAHSALESRGAMQAALEDTHAELRAQLEGLTGAVQADRAEMARRTAALEQERDDLSRQLAELSAELTSIRDQLTHAMAAQDRAAVEVGRLRGAVAAAGVARDAAVSEAAGLRTELARLGADLAATRERVSAETGDLGEAQRLLADARALAAEIGAGDAPADPGLPRR